MLGLSSPLPDRPSRSHLDSDADDRFRFRREVSEEPGAETREVSDGVDVDIDARGNLVGFDIDRASNQLDLSSVETTALPLRLLQDRVAGTPLSRANDHYGWSE